MAPIAGSRIRRDRSSARTSSCPRASTSTSCRRKRTSSTSGSSPGAVGTASAQRREHGRCRSTCTSKAPTSIAAGSSSRCCRRSARPAKPPFKSVLTHGFTVDEKGMKQSKSLGNYVNAQDEITKYGADILRLWVSSVNYQEDVRCNDELIGRTQDAYRKIRNTLRYLFGNINDFDPNEGRRPVRADARDRQMGDAAAAEADRRSDRGLRGVRLPPGLLARSTTSARSR